MSPMKVVTAQVVDGRLDVPEEGFRLSVENQALLLESIAQADRGEVVDGWQLLDELGQGCPL